MREIDVVEAERDFLALLAEAERSGETVAITRDGRPVARIVPERLEPKDPGRPLRTWTRKEIDEHFRWLEELERRALEDGAEPFDWKEAVEEGRK